MDKEEWVFGFLVRHRTIKLILILAAAAILVFVTIAVLDSNQEMQLIPYSNGITHVTVISDSPVEFSSGLENEVIVQIGQLQHNIRPVFDSQGLGVERKLYSAGVDITDQLVYANCVNISEGIGMDCMIYGNNITFQIDVETSFQ